MGAQEVLNLLNNAQFMYTPIRMELSKLVNQTLVNPFERENGP